MKSKGQLAEADVASLSTVVTRDALDRGHAFP